MPLPVRLTFRGLPPSDAVATHVQTEADGLPTVASSVLRCAVVVEAENRSARHGDIFRVRADLTTPGHEIVAAEHGPDAHAAVDAVFDHVQRQLADLPRRRRRGAGGQGTVRSR